MAKVKQDYFHEATSFGNLYKGLKKTCKTVRWKDSVITYETNGLKNTYKLMKSIRDGTYTMSPYQEFTIYEPKERHIVATRIKDRQLQRSICDSGLYNDICEHFIISNVACQVGKGTDEALRQMKIILRKAYNKYGNTTWVLKCDIHHFFESTDHQVAHKIIDKYVSDKQAADVVHTIIDSFDVGIGLGSQVSQLIELLVLNRLDHIIKERLHIKYYIRYMDDFILIHQDKEYLKYCWKIIEEELADIGLSLNKKTSLYPTKQGVKFLQWKFIYSDTGKIIMLMNSKKISKEKKRIKKLLELEAAGLRPKGTARISLDCWLANAKRGNTYKIQCAMNKYFENMEEQYGQ